jgi:6-phosphogluconolactonase
LRLRQPTGKFAYVTSLTDETVSGYSIDHKSGALTPVSASALATGGEPIGIAVDPNGKFTYVTNNSSNTVSGYRVDPLTGSLTPLPGSPFGVAAGPYAVAIDPTAQFAYVTNTVPNTISAYLIDCDGYLTLVSGSSLPTGATPVAIAITK